MKKVDRSFGRVAGTKNPAHNASDHEGRQIKERWAFRIHFSTVLAHIRSGWRVEALSLVSSAPISACLSSQFTRCTWTEAWISASSAVVQQPYNSKTAILCCICSKGRMPIYEEHLNVRCRKTMFLATQLTCAYHLFTESDHIVCLFRGLPNPARAKPTHIVLWRQKQ